jgi:hypothetical protein
MATTAHFQDEGSGKRGDAHTTIARRAMDRSRWDDRFRAQLGLRLDGERSKSGSHICVQVGTDDQILGGSVDRVTGRRDGPVVSSRLGACLDGALAPSAPLAIRMGRDQRASASAPSRLPAGTRVRSAPGECRVETGRVRCCADSHELRYGRASRADPG